MNDEIERLKREYRRIEAPPELAGGIRTAVARLPGRRRAWLPAAFAAATVVAIALWALPVMMVHKDSHPVAPPMPSLSTIAGLTPEKPAMVTPGLSNLRSVPTLATPEKPERIQEEDPQTRIRNPESTLEEINHAEV